jgi:hypothetical protein
MIELNIEPLTLAIHKAPTRSVRRYCGKEARTEEGEERPCFSDIKFLSPVSAYKLRISV